MWLRVVLVRRLSVQAVYPVENGLLRTDNVQSLVSTLRTMGILLDEALRITSYRTSKRLFLVLSMVTFRFLQNAIRYLSGVFV